MRRGTGRLRAPIGVLAVLVLVLTACAGRSGPPSYSIRDSRAPVSQPARAAEPVPVRTFAPFAATAPALARTLSGSCWTSSIAVSRPLAYRCFAGGEILDPCFARTRTDRSVACFVDPWTAGIRLDVARALPADGPIIGAARPWALELANGARCIAATGVVGRVGATVLLYRCGRAGAAGGPSAGLHPSVRFAVGSSVTPVAVDVIWTA
jgi:hypothetical protein